MEIVLFAIALMLLLAAGSGAVWLISSHERKFSLHEFLALSFLFGATLVSLFSFGLGWLLKNWSLRCVLILLCFSLFISGMIRTRRQRISISITHPTNAIEYFFSLILITQFVLLFWLSLHSPLNWDGLFNWEIKARLACLNDGAIPGSYFSDPAYKFSHPEYPLLLPLTEAWFYNWMGSCHQGSTKLLLPFFYLACAALLGTLAWRCFASRMTAWLAALLTFFVPLVITREGSIISGYADIPLATYYLAAVLLLFDALESGETRAVWFFGIAAAMMPWLKQEGAILWAILMMLCYWFAWRRKQWRSYLPAVLPGLLMIFGWMIFVKVMKAPVGQDFESVTITEFITRLNRVPVILKVLATELISYNRWSLLWPGLLLSLFFLNLRELKTRLLYAVTLLPLLVYPGIYLFYSTRGAPLENHMALNFPRLLLHVAPLAVLLMTGGIMRDKFTKLSSTK